MELNTQPTYDELLAQVAKLEKEKANAGARGTSLKVSEKGGVSFYGVGRFPVSLYESQWRTILDKGPEILAFLEANKALLSSKPVKA